MLAATLPLTQEADTSRTTLVDARNGFNELIQMVMLCMVRHRWPAVERFSFNYYIRWVQLLLRQPGYAQVVILSR